MKNNQAVTLAELGCGRNDGLLSFVPFTEEIIIPKIAYRKEEIVKMKVENVDNVVDFCVERIKKEGCEVELRSYETTDGRMKYELYVKLPEK